MQPGREETGRKESTGHLKDGLFGRIKTKGRLSAAELGLKKQCFLGYGGLQCLFSLMESKKSALKT